MNKERGTMNGCFSFIILRSDFILCFVFPRRCHAGVEISPFRFRRY